MYTAVTSFFRNIFSITRQALKGGHMNYTTGSIPRSVFLLAIPMILELSLESVFAVVDMFFVGKLGENAIATVGYTEAVITLVYSLAIGISTAATAIVARRTGEKQPEAAAQAGAQSLLVAFAVSVFITAAGTFFAPQILQLMGAKPGVVQQGAVFTRIMFSGSLVIMLLFLINGIFRGVGDAAMAMRSLWLASLTNIILCPVLIHFFGLKGAAMATVTGRTTGVLYQCYHLFKGNSVLKFYLPHFKWNSRLIKSIVNLGWPATFQFMLGSGSWIVLTWLVTKTGGTTAAAGYQIAFRNFVFFILPAWGLSNAAATLVGQNLGAGQVERAEKSVYITAKYSVILMGAVMIFFLLFAQYIIRIFSGDPAIIAYGTRALKIVGAGFIFYGLAMVITQALNGAGDTKNTTIITGMGFWLFQVPVAFLLAYPFHLQATGAFIAIPAAEAFIALVSFYYFRRGNWKKVKV